MEHIILKNDIIEATIRVPTKKPISKRFDDAGVVEQVVLNGKHHFCQPEQHISSRSTTYGTGLCGEFAWPGLATNILPGQHFPKLGVGILTQHANGGDYHILDNNYEVEPFDRSHTVFSDRVEFIQYPTPCMGIAAKIFKTVHIYANTITVTTTIENTGEKTLDLYEYQHNFVSLGNLPIGPGYRLDVPYDGTISEIGSYTTMNSAQDGSLVPDILYAKDQSIYWNKTLDEMSFCKITEKKDILTLPFYRWTLSHTSSPARISEVSHFTPARLVMWGIEHTVSVEAYVKILVPPNGKQTFARTWLFEVV